MEVGFTQGYMTRILGIFFRFIILVFVFQHAIISMTLIDGPSMEPYFSDQDRGVVLKFAYFFQTPQRGDVIQSYHPTQKDTLITKRIIGLPGETVTITNNGVLIEGVGDSGAHMLVEPYLAPATATTIQQDHRYRFTVPADEYFVLGDNRIVSNDSRTFGTVHRKFINGKVISL